MHKYIVTVCGDGRSTSRGAQAQMSYGSNSFTVCCFCPLTKTTASAGRIQMVRRAATFSVYPHTAPLFKQWKSIQRQIAFPDICSKTKNWKAAQKPEQEVVGKSEPHLKPGRMTGIAHMCKCDDLPIQAPNSGDQIEEASNCKAAQHQELLSQQRLLFE